MAKDKMQLWFVKLSGSYATRGVVVKARTEDKAIKLALHDGGGLFDWRVCGVTNLTKKANAAEGPSVLDESSYIE
tara:strand:+ start:1644 stop:1868 length:225 start_codon:yes stop_codon:yes gene_type:complete